MKTTILPLKHPMNRVHFALALLLVPLALAWFGISPTARAECQKGCLAGDNTVLGDDALLNETGSLNTAIGVRALYSNTTGLDNTAMGWEALYSNTTGIANTAIGPAALNANSTGSGNTAVGLGALAGSRTGNNNTATGGSALGSNDTGSFNTANGVAALILNAAGSHNTASGWNALYNNTDGNNNTANGSHALENNTGNANIAIGYEAGLNLTTGSNNISIGNTGTAADTGIIRIGTAGIQTATFISGIREAPLVHGAAVAVGITADGQLGVRASSARFKEAIKPMDKASEAILALKPVTFRYKKELDPESIPQFGLVAEQVETVNPDLVAGDAEGKPYTVRYEAVNAMLLNEFLKEHRKVQELEANAARQQKQIEALTAGLQKVSAQLELSKSAPQTVLNNQ